MKKYSDVIADRYDKEEIGVKVNTGMQKVYAHGLEQLKKCISEVIEIAEKRGLRVEDCTLLDIGCGDGTLMQCWEEVGIQRKNMTGVDLSSKRVARAKTNLPESTFIEGDIVSFELDKQFDLVVVFDVFSHLNTEEEILNAMASVKRRLKPNGLFVWYDICSRDHFNSPPNADSWGFNPTQFQNYLQKGGYRVIHKRNVFKNFFYRYQSIYQVRRFPKFLVRLAETVIPGPPGNIMFVSEVIK